MDGYRKSALIYFLFSKIDHALILYIYIYLHLQMKPMKELMAFFSSIFLVLTVPRAHIGIDSQTLFDSLFQF